METWIRKLSILKTLKTSPKICSRQHFHFSVLALRNQVRLDNHVNYQDLLSLYFKKHVKKLSSAAGVFGTLSLKSDAIASDIARA